jgi:glycerophosphoryl diester phosphodiesterase
MRRLLEWGVDGLISNRPDVAVRVRDEFVRRRTAPAG